MAIELIKPHLDYLESALEAFCDGYALGYEQADFWQYPKEEPTEEKLAQYIEDTAYFSQGKRLLQGWVPYTVFWLVDVSTKTFLGTCNVRHELNDFLLNYAGQIGYVIAPKQRRRGYGLLQLQYLVAAIPKTLSTKHLQNILLTCNEGNVASKKIIEQCGGVYEDTRYWEREGVNQMRYWIFF